MGERRRGESGEPGTGFPAESEDSSSLLQRAVAVLQSSYLDSTSQDGFQYSQAILVENDLFLSELKAFARAKEAAGYSQEELQETFAFLLFDKEEEAKEVCQSGLRVNSSSISTLGDPAKGVYISRYADCLHPRPWHHGKSAYIVICKLIKGKVRMIAENSTTTSTCPSPGYDCHVSKHSPSKSSSCQAFEQSQYYVYEVSGGSAAERPRQVCPYIFLTCQYREPQDSPAVALQNPVEHKHKALYCPWKGQLSIQGQLLCTIALRTPYSSTIPAQLPPTLDINHVMGLSDLKKKLPEAAFGKKNYTKNEVCFQGVYSSLYEVEISNKDQQKMDQLVENLKEKDLAIIKYVQDQGVLILLTSSALAREEGLEPKDPVSLLALFLFPSPRALSPTVEKRDPKDGKRGSDRSNISLKITSVLPGLRYALRKAADSSWNSSGSTSTWIKEHLQEYAKLQENSQPTSEQNGDISIPSSLSPSEDEASPPSQKLSERSLAQLRSYLSDPNSFTLGMSAALECLSGASSNLRAHPGNSSSAVPPNPAPPERRGRSAAPNPAPELEGSPKNVNSPSKLWGQQNRRKSNRILGRNPSPLRTHPGEDDSKNREATKKKTNTTSSLPKKSGSAANSNEPMLKLANLQLPHGRKRGAEVLAAEIVHKPQGEAAEKESAPPDAPGLEAKRPKTLENSDTKKVPVAESGTKPGKSKTPKSVENRTSKPSDNKQAESERKEPLSDLPSETSSQSHGAEIQRNEVYPVGIPSSGFAPREDNCESHALNLLADLALGSCIPPFIPKDSGMIPMSHNLPSDSTEPQNLSKPKSLRVASDHKYHRAEKQGGKKATLCSKVSPNQPLPEKPDPNHLASPPKEKTSGIFDRNSVNPTPAKLQVLPPREAPEASEVNKHSIISAEHSYASPMPEHPKKQQNPKGNSNSGPALSKNGTRNSPAGPLIGKVLPFRHQQSSTSEPSRSIPKKKEDFAKSHTVNVSGNSMKVTCFWEEDYLFHLDSRYTNDSLEKTVIRALHGPWDPDLPDDVEGMKLILHMWVALFYRKPSKLLSSSRKVVEHSNPTKFVSINSSGGFLELSDDSQDCFTFETRPADSGSDPDQTPSSSLDPSTPSQGLSQPEKSPADSQTDADGIPGAVDNTVSSSSGELPCGEEEEPSSTSCPESLSLQDNALESLDVGDREEVVPEEDTRDVTAEEPVKENLLDSRITPSPSQEPIKENLVDSRITSSPSQEPVKENLVDSRITPSPSQEPVKENLLDSRITPSPSQELIKENLLDSRITPSPSQEPVKENLVDSRITPSPSQEPIKENLLDSRITPSPSQEPVKENLVDSRITPSPSQELIKENLLDSGITPSPSQELIKENLLDSGITSSPSQEPVKENLLDSRITPSPSQELIKENLLDSGITSSPSQEPVKENLLDSRITPSPSQELSCSSKSPTELGTENPGSQSPNSSSAPWTDPLPVLQENGKEKENQWEAGSGSGPGPPEDGEGMGDAGDPLEGEDGSWATGVDPQPPCDSMPLEANPASAEAEGATEEGEESQEPLEHSGREEREVEEEKEEEKEEFEDENSSLGPVDLVLSESSDTEMECGLGKNSGNSASPEEFGAPEEESMPSPTSLASPCPDRSTPALSDGAGTDPGEFPEEMSPNRDELPDPWDAPATPDSETNGVGMASLTEMGSPHSDSGELLSPADHSPAHEAQPDSVTENLGAAGDALGNGLEQKDQDCVPSTERSEPAGSTACLESLHGQGMTLTLSPDSSSVCLTSPDGSVDPWAAPEDPPMESLQSPSQSELGRSSCCSQGGGDDADPELNSLDTEESNQGGSEVLVEEQDGSGAASGTEELDDPMGAGDGRDSPLDYADIEDDSRAEEREDEFPEAENSPENDTMSMEMVTDAPEEPEIPLHHHLQESEPSSSIWEGISAIKELPRQQQNFPNIHRDSAPASPPHDRDSNLPIPVAPSRRESVLCRLWKPCQEGEAAQVSVAAWSLDGSLNPSSSQEVLKAPLSPADEFMPAEPGSAPPSPCDPWDDPEGAEPGSIPEALPGMLPPSPDSARWSRSCSSPGSQAGDATGSPGEEPFPPEDLEGGSIPSPAPFPARECSLCEPWASCEHSPEGSEVCPDPDCTEVGEGEILASPIPASPLDEHRDGSGESPELSDAEDILDELPREEQLPSQDGDEGSAFEDPMENSFGDSDQEYFEGNSHSPLPCRNSCIMSSVDAAGTTRTNWDSSSRSSVHMEEHGEDWDRGIPRDYGSFMVTRQCRERMENFQLPKRHHHRSRESPLLQSLMGSWRGFEEMTQNTLDMECLRFHYKLKEILRNGKPPFSTSKSIFPKDFSAPIPLSPRSRSPLQVTIPPSDVSLVGLHSRRRRDHRDTGRDRSRAGSREQGANFHLGKLRYDRAPPDSRGDVAVILDEYSEFQRVVLSRAEVGSEGLARGEAGNAPGEARNAPGEAGNAPGAAGNAPGEARNAPGEAGNAPGEAGNAQVRMALPGGTEVFQGMISELRRALSFHLRRVAEGQPGMFYLLETGQEPFFDRVKALLKDEGFVRMEPQNFCGAQRQDRQRLLVIVRNEDISSHIHSVPCLLELKRCPGVVFAGVDDPEDVTGDTFQELFQAGGFVVSDEELLERVTLGQLKEVVKVLEKLNRNGRWKWLLHHRESRKLRGDLSRDDANAQKKQLLLKWCQGAELVELLHFHSCDSTAAPESQRIQCLLELQVQHIHARFAVYLTENPSDSSREILESKGILVADINTFLGTVQKVAAPFRRSYW